MIVAPQDDGSTVAGASDAARPLVLCADDFGLGAEIDEAILALIEAERLTATGCMVAGAQFEADAPRLAALSDRADIGLHFALTELSPLGPMPAFAPDGRPQELGSVLARALTGRLVYAEIAAEIGRQIDRFREVFGRSPDFVDGHQHVHVLPTVRKALFAAFDEGRLDRRTTWVRDCHEPALAIVRRGIEVPKTLLVSVLSGGMARAAARRGVTVNDGFRGVTAFAADGSFGANFRSFLEGEGRRPLIMCHPAEPGAGGAPGDAIAAARHDEWTYFSGDTFPADLAAAGLRLVRMGSGSEG
ncbi:ChbG/HpnK family deacetylase [Pinisolibacter sp.]|uniref:ChbG/HpnK family deacetylase n=1 Tax=Pinisolibacter sp. TaxID=2172024 RepID=UPI002FDD3A53